MIYKYPFHSPTSYSKLRLTRFERATPSLGEKCSSPAELQSHMIRNLLESNQFNPEVVQLSRLLHYRPAQIP